VTEQAVPMTEYRWGHEFPAELAAEQALFEHQQATWIEKARGQAQHDGVTLPEGEPTITVRWRFEVLKYERAGGWYVEEAYSVETPKEATKGIFVAVWDLTPAEEPSEPTA
jgi:hypothetical protein